MKTKTVTVELSRKMIQNATIEITVSANQDEGCISDEDFYLACQQANKDKKWFDCYVPEGNSYDLLDMF